MRFFCFQVYGNGLKRSEVNGVILLQNNVHLGFWFPIRMWKYEKVYCCVSWCVVRGNLNNSSSGVELDYCIIC